MSLRRSIGSAILVLAMVCTTLAVAPQTARAAGHDAELGNNLAAAGSALAAAQELPSLAPMIPGLGTNPAQLLGLDRAFGDLAALAGAADIEAAINGLPDTAGFDYEFVSTTEAAGVHTLVFNLSATRSLDVPLVVMNEGVSIVGSNVSAEVSLAPTPITVELDTNLAGPDAFAFIELPTFELSVSVAAAPNVPIIFGFADATADGTVALQLPVHLTLNDPDGLDRVTGSELVNLAIADLVTIVSPSDATPDLAISLAITADVFGTDFDGLVTIEDTALFDDPPPEVTVDTNGTNPISLLTNIGPDTAITSLSQLLAGYGAAMVAGDVGLPFVGDGVFIPQNFGVGDAADFDQIFDVVAPLVDYVTPRSVGQIVCGSTVGTDPDGEGVGDDGIPAGPANTVPDNQPIYCRAYTAQNGGVSWNVISGGSISGPANNPATIGIDPTENIVIEAGPGDFAIELTFTPEDASGPQIIKQRPDTIQKLVTELADLGLIPTVAGVPTFDYDAATESFSFPLEMTADPISRSATIDAGNSLVAETGLTGLAARGTGAADLTLSDISASVTLGLIIADDETSVVPLGGSTGDPEPGPGNRIYIAASQPILSVGTVEVSASLEAEGRLGFLEVDADIVGTLSKPDTGPAVAVSLNAGPGISVGGEPIPSAILLRDLLRSDLGTTIDTNINLEFVGSGAVRAQAVEGLSADAGFSITWDLNEASPTIFDFTGGYDDRFLPFGGGLELTQVGSPNADPTVLTVDDGATNLLATPGLVGSQLVDDDDAVCNITAVLSSTTLTCTNPSGNVENPITFIDGGSYEVKGNTLATLGEILAAIDDLVSYLEEDVLSEGDLNSPIGLIGISPAELFDQLGEIKRMLKEFRGIQDAQISCQVQGSIDADVRAIPMPDAGAPPTLNCAAVAPTDVAQNVTWTLVDPEPLPDNDTNGPVDGADATVGAAADPAVSAASLTLAADLDANGDGYISIGSEYSVAVEWSDENGQHQAAFPPRVPQSLQHLSDLITETLGLPSDVLTFELVDAGTNPTLRINLGFGICSDKAFAPDGDAICDDAAVGGGVDANLNLDLAALPDLVALDAEAAFEVDYAAIATFDIGIPLDGTEPVLYGSTGFEAHLAVVGSDISIDASLGPVGAKIGTSATGPNGIAEVDSASSLTSAGAFANAGPGMIISRGADTCIVTATISDDEVSCALDWTTGDTFTQGGRGELEVRVSLGAQLTDGAALVPDTESVSIGTAGVQLSGLDELGTTSECGPIDESVMTQLTGGASSDPDVVTGLGCAQLSLAAEIGSEVIYLGELDVELDFDELRIWAPADLGTRLGDALLDPSLWLHLLPDFLQEIEDAMRNQADSGLPAAVGDPLRTGADGLAATRALVEDAVIPFADALDGLQPDLPLRNMIEDELELLLNLAPDTVIAETDCGAGFGSCDGMGLEDLIDVRVSFTYGDMVMATTGINIGLEGLPLSVDAGASAEAAWNFKLGLGVSLDDGPYIAVDDTEDEFSLAASVSLDAGATGCTASTIPGGIGAEYTTERCIRAKLGFLELEALDNIASPTAISAGLSLNVEADPGSDRITLSDLASGNVTLTPTISGEINVNLHLRTGLATGPDLPTILGTFELSWDVVGGGDPEVSFANLHLDIGTVINDFLKPVATEIRKITGPLQPIIDVITAPIPVVSDLSELVGGPQITMIKVLEEASDADLSLIKSVAAFITFINAVPDAGAIEPIPLGALVGGTREAGEFSVDAAMASKPVSSTEAGGLIKQDATYKGGSGFTADVGDAAGGGLGNLTPPNNDRPSTFGVPGLSFPFLEDAGQIFGVLVGRDATLIRWDAGTMEASAGLSYDFGPIMVGPVPITITIGGEIGIRGRFAIGYDTSGIRKVLDGGSGVALFDGIFIDDLDANGNDVPEVTFFGRIFAGASVDLLIVSAGVRGGIELTFTLDLDDRPDPDGKLRIEEIADKLANPICLFVVGGKIEAFLEAFVEIDLFFYSEEFSFELVRLTLLEWSSACEPPEPKVADFDDATGVLYLLVGSRRGERNVAVETVDERIEVRQLDPNTVRVSAFGWEEVYEGVNLVVADGGVGHDEILLLPGPVPEGGEPEDAQRFTIPSVIYGGAGNDAIKTGAGADLIYGDDTISAAGIWEGVSYADTYPDDSADDLEPEQEDPGNDSINAGHGDDVIKAGAGNDGVEGEFGRDTIEGGEGSDSLNGGPGGDAVLGQGGVDSVHGGPIARPDPLDTEADIDDNDALSGGLGIDTVSGDFGSDVMFGDEPVGSYMDADPVDMRRTGFSALPSVADWQDWCGQVEPGEPDLMTGNGGNDFMVGGAGADDMDGNEGNDYVCGSDGDDTLFGSNGDDTLRGDADADVIEGNDGDDLIFGGGGDDVANGNDGDDDIFGDAGSDILYGDADQDIVVGDGGEVLAGHLHGVANGTVISPSRVETLDDLVERDSVTSGMRRVSCATADAIGDSDCIFGGSGSDALFGGSDGDIISGDAGVDLLEGNHGDDLLRGGTDNDLLFGNLDDDTMFGDGADDEMFGDRSIDAWATPTPEGVGVDTMFGGPGADHMEGDGGDDAMFGGAGPDHMEGNDGDDAMFGQTGNDDLIGGSDDPGEPDGGETVMSGGDGNDVIAGDNAVIGPDGYVGGRSVHLLDPSIGDGDIMAGDGATDYMFGQRGDDDMSGGDADDYMEGNDGDDRMNGDAGDDDMIGGGSADDGLITADRVGTGLPDSGEALMAGGVGLDWMAGDNARMNRVLEGLSGNDALVDQPIVLFDLGSVGGLAVPATAHGADTMTGGPGSDFMFGQGSNDDMSGNEAGDYLEGNDGSDTMAGGGGDDDMVGGGSATNGVIVSDRDGEGLFDQGETSMTGGLGIDWMAGDNAFMNRVLFNNAATPIDLFDVNSPDEAAVSGGDTIAGNEGEDLIFGQGNGSQGNQSDPPDGLDNDGDGAVDEDAAWLGDDLSGGPDDDYIEGNAGSDLIEGNGGDDDLIGGGSALNGVFVPDRDGNGLFDARDTVYGGEGNDVLAGDNARVNREGDLTGLLLTTDREITLFDVDETNVALSGGDFLAGGSERDLMFGQGNGAQAEGQADPNDGVDNDFDGREGAESTQYDCADNGFDNDADGTIDGADAGCSGSVDEDMPWDGDIMFGNGGDDYMEGNAGADWMFGGDDEDDMVGGGSAANGAITPERDPMGLRDGPDVMHGDGEDDVMTGDNARINRAAVGGAWARISSTGVASAPGYSVYDQAVRSTDMFDADAGAHAHGNDYMTGGTGNDEMIGQLGDDFVLGNSGDDALVGDLGQVRANVLGDGVGDDPAQTVISTNSPHWEATVNEVGSLLWETELYAYDTSSGGVGGDDVLLGYDGRDTAFGGPGNDIINGDGDGTEETFDLERPEVTHITDVDPATVDQDMLFGGDDADALWGGRDDDVLMGGHGDDHLDVRPREETDNGRNGANFRIIPRDPPLWHTYANAENFQDVDFLYGGWDQDALQADQAENGPDSGDRLADWAGGYNVFYLCPSGYGDYSIARTGSPSGRRFIQDLAEASGAYLTSDGGTSGYRDVGFVFPNQRGANATPVHPDHPGHFTCADFTGVGSGTAAADAGGPYVVEEGGTVGLDGTGSVGAGGVASYDWDGGILGIDDVTSPTPTLDAIGGDDGVVVVALEIIDAEGAMAFDTTDVEIVNVAPVVSIDVLPAAVELADVVALEASYGDAGVLDTHSVLIDWGDGVTCDPAADTDCELVAAGGAGTVTGNHTYGALGDYDVVVTVTDDDGGIGLSETTTVSVGEPAPPEPVLAQDAAAWEAADPWAVDPITIGGVDYSRTEALDIMDDGGNNEQSSTLFREVVAALLNADAGTETTCIDQVLSDADVWLTTNPPGSGVKKNSAAWQEAEPHWEALLAYNEGDACE